MGLTLHYSLKARGSDAQARKLIQALHQTALDMTFEKLGEVVELSDDQCGFNKRDKAEPLRWLLIQAQEDLELVSGPEATNAWSAANPTNITATTIISDAWLMHRPLSSWILAVVAGHSWRPE